MFLEAVGSFENEDFGLSEKYLTVEGRLNSHVVTLLKDACIDCRAIGHHVTHEKPWTRTTEMLSANLEFGRTSLFNNLSKKVAASGTKIGESISAEKKSDGSSEMQGSFYITKEDGKGNSLKAEAGGTIETDNKGQTSYGGKVKISAEHEF